MENIYSVLSDLYTNGAVFAFHQARRRRVVRELLFGEEK